MASIIRIKRSSVSGNPATLGTGELAYSALTDNGSNGGDRLYIGMGTETAGNAANHYVVGGKYFTDMLDQTPGVLTASSALVVDASKKLDELLVDNLSLNGNTLSTASGNLILDSYTGMIQLSSGDYIAGGSFDGSQLILDGVAELKQLRGGSVSLIVGASGTATSSLVFNNDGSLTVPGTVKTLSNGDLTLAPNGTGKLVLNNPYINGTSDTLAEFIYDTVGGAITAGTGITITNADVGNTSTVAIDSTVATLTGTQALTNKTVNGLTITSSTGTLTIANGKTLTASNTLTFTGTDASSVAFSAGGTVAYVADKLSVFAATSSSELAGVISDETGTGGLVFANTPTLVTPVLGAATATSITATSGNMVINAAAGNNNVNLVPTGTGTVDVGSKRITSLAEPSADSDAATKYYVDAARSGLDIKNSVKVATTANITLSNTQTIDGVALSVGDRVLVKDQSSAVQNGVYVVASGSWTRATDADAPAELNPGTFVFVEQGTVNSDTGFVVTSDGALTIGTDAINWTLFSTSGTLIAGAGLSKNGYTLEVNVANGIEVSSDNVQLASSVAGAGLTYSSGVLNVVGTADRITVNADSIDIASTYVGQSTITTLGTIGTGVWQGTVIAGQYGGTGVNNSGKTITLGGSFTHTGAHTLGLTTTANTSVTLPTTGTLATLAGTESFSNKTFSNTTNFSGNVTGAGAATSTLDGFNIDGGTY